MKSMNFKQGCILSEQGESRLLRAALASEFLAEVLSVPTVNAMFYIIHERELFQRKALRL
ncbi:hypothetical protein EIMP300_36120 [Escherichia coli]|uniref:Uncharacterized protein n=1 Tax=Escherichia coli TaxID=562 RepID=A0A8S0FPT6_ECOLX|nr:hypothetical protein EIMP300_36120 [Escherichia coli]